MTITAKHVARVRPARNIPAATAAAALFLEALGVDLTSEILHETPARMARAYAKLLTARVQTHYVRQRRGLRRARHGPRHPDPLGV